ncbi:Ig-like domain-containing protein [Paraglaciecola sp. L3A3]|uniref:Ig-like domain-containing protein n=1 Tax=Paraglaciecola sp. L3A3 TaxID=2686358 RepID=UPI00131AD38F|nr:Ig-like domain-containing protein [Paraglaciecola sp. L3A3]
MKIFKLSKLTLAIALGLPLSSALAVPFDPALATDGDAFTFEAESFESTGGTVPQAHLQGMINQAWGNRDGVTFSNQGGDWVDYTINFPTTGYYRVHTQIASHNNPTAKILLYVGKNKLAEEESGANGWHDLTITDGIYIEAGEHNVRLESQTTGWAWAADTVTFTALNSSGEDFDAGPAIVDGKPDGSSGGGETGGGETGGGETGGGETGGGETGGGETNTAYQSDTVTVDINLDMRHEVKGISDFNRKKHITIHSNYTEADWNGQADTMNYLMNDLDVYFGRDNGMAGWIFRATAQDPDNLGTPDLDEVANFGQWHKDNMYDILPESIRAYEDRADEMIMGITPHGPFPTQSYWPAHLAGKDEDPGKYILRDIEVAAEYVGEYLDKFMRKSDETSGYPMPKYWEVINEPDMDVNVGHTFMVSSFEQIFEYHNLVAEQINDKLPEGERPLVGGMTWGLHDLDAQDLSTRFKDQQSAIRARYAAPNDSPEGLALEDFLQDITTSEHWATRTDQFYQWDYLWKGFMDAAGDNMDFYSIHLYDWSGMDNDPQKGSKIRSGMTTEAILDMVEWYDAQVNGKENLKPWVISEYGAIASGHSTLPFLQEDYRYADWLHIRSFNQMFMQLLKRPSQIVKSMPFIVAKAKWGAYAVGDDVVRYEPALIQSEAGADTFFTEESEWFVTDKIQWYELWSDVKGTRVDTHSNDPDVQVDAYVDGNHTYLILNNLEYFNIPVDLSFMGANGNNVKSVNMKHSYLAEGLSPTNLGRAVLAQAMLNELPESVTLQAGSTIILDIEFNDDVAITAVSKENKYFAESLSGAGKGEAAKGQIHRVLGDSVTANVNGVEVPTEGEASLRISARFYPFHASNPRSDLNNFTINGHTLAVRKQTDPNTQGVATEHLDLMGADTTGQGVAMNFIEIPIPLEYLKEDNVITAKIGQGQAFTAMSISTWDMSKAPARSSGTECDPCTAASSMSITGNSAVFIKETIALKANVLPMDADNMVIEWTSSNVLIAAVDQNGLVTGTGTGTATITAKTADGSITATQEVTVSTIQPSSVELNMDSADLGVNDQVLLNASIAPFNASNKSLTWSSSNEAVVTVSASGLVTAVAAGSATITAEAEDGGASDTVAINVTNIALTDIELVSTAVIVLPGNYQANVSFTPSNATNQDVTWQSATPSIASVSNAGLISGVAAGTTTITATSADGGFTETITVSVIEEAAITATPVDVEAETVSATGGAFGGFDTGEFGINNNQSGDWADFNIDFAEAGVYRVILDAGTPTDPVNGVEVFIDGVSAGTANIPTTGDWDVMQSTVITNNLLVATAGTHTIRIMSIGADAKWQWNADKLTFILLAGLAAEPVDPTDPTDPVDPADIHQAPAVVNDSVVIQAESFANTGGTHEGFIASEVGINNNQTGDWADYPVNFTAKGTYQLVTLLGVNGDAAGIEVSLRDASDTPVYSKTLNPAQSAWEDYQPLDLGNDIEITETGLYTLRIKSVGAANYWQWNADYYTLTKTADEGGAVMVTGDYDSDGDVDINDVRGLVGAIQSRETIDMAFDMNDDGVVNILDSRVMMSICTRARCVTE